MATRAGSLTTDFGDGIRWSIISVPRFSLYAGLENPAYLIMDSRDILVPKLNMPKMYLS
jgi:hypothetical protein